MASCRLLKPDGERRVALEVINVDLEYGPKPRAVDTGDPVKDADDNDIPF